MTWWWSLDVFLTDEQCRDRRVGASRREHHLSESDGDLLGLFGLDSEGKPYAWSDRYLRMQDGTVLQYHGPASLLNLAGAEAVASLQPEFDWPKSLSRGYEVQRRAAGSFAFDLTRSVVLSHQGRSDQASDGPNRNTDGDGAFRMNNLFINHLDPRCKMIPQADVLQDLFVEMIYWATERVSPIPRIWHFPHEQPAVAFMSVTLPGTRSDVDFIGTSGKLGPSTLCT